MALLESARAFLGSRWGAALKLLAGAGVIAVVVCSVDWGTLGALASKARPAHVLLIMAVAIVAHLVGAARFKLLCDPVLRLPLLTQARQYFIASCFGLFLPNFGGDAIRMVMLSQSGFTASQATALVISERVIGVVSLLLLSAIGGVFSELPLLTTGILVAAALAAVLVLEVGRRVGAAIKPKQAWAASALDALNRGLGVERVGRVLVASVVYQALIVSATALVAWSLALDVPTATIFALAPLVWFATMLPLTLGGLGIREAGFLVVFGWAGVPREPALLLSLGTYAGIVAVGLAGAAWFGLDRLRGAGSTPSASPP